MNDDHTPTAVVGAWQTSALHWEAVTLADKVKQDLADAMRAGERDRVGRLRLVLSELQKAAKDGNDDEVARPAPRAQAPPRRRRSSSATAGRDELAAGEEAEAELIGGYLPAELSDEELRAHRRRGGRRGGRDVAEGHGRR